MNTTKVEKVFAKVSLNAQPSDFAYWQAQPYEARLAALEQIRHEYHGWKCGETPRVEKIATIINQKNLSHSHNMWLIWNNHSQ